VKPDTILPLIDFAAVHMYPISYHQLDWQQVWRSAGRERAAGHDGRSLVVAKAYFDEVAHYKYVGPGARR